MFFIGIFGIGSREKEIKSFGSVVCPGCGAMTQAALSVTYSYFHIFFIPTFRWNRKYFLKTRCCGSIWEVPAEYAKQLEHSDDVDFTRLKKVSAGFGGYRDMFRTCPNCGRNFDAEFSYCPYCGARQ